MKKADDAFFKMTKNKQRFKFDYREDGKLDVTFVRMDRKARSGGWNVNYPDYYLTKNGFNNPKKCIYLLPTLLAEMGDKWAHIMGIFL